MPTQRPLSQLKAEALDEIKALMAARHDITPLAFKAGERIIREGDRSQYVYVVLEGAYRVEQAAGEPSEAPAVLANVTCDPGSFTVIGEMACLGDDVRTASVIATAPTRVLCLKPAHIDAIIEECPRLTSVLLRQFATRLFEANQRIRDLDELLTRTLRRREQAGMKTAMPGKAWPPSTR